MRTAQDLMTGEPKMIASNDSLQDVIKLFLTVGITSSPVISPLGEILGILTELSLVKAYMLHKAKFHKSDKVGHHIDLLQPVHYIQMDASLTDVVKEIIGSPTNRLLVRNEKKKVVGIISPKDLMRAMLGEVNPSQSQNLKDRLAQAELKLKKSLEAMSNMEKHLEVYQRVFHETPYMMHAVNENGEIIMANKREHEILGYENGELVGKSIFDIYAQQMHAQAKEGLKKIINEGHFPVTFTMVVTKTGEIVKCDIASSSIRDDQGKFISSISALRPIDSEEFVKNIAGLINDKQGPLSEYINDK